MYKVTIGIPVYNVEKYIEKSLLSALNQTFNSIEYIIVDGGGTDKSMNIVRDIVASHPRRNNVVILTQLKNLGIGEDRNLIIKNTKSEYLFFLDSDDDITTDCIQKLYEAAMMNPCADIITAHNRVIYPNYTYERSYEYHKYTTKQEIFHAYLKGEVGGVFWNKLYRVDFLKRNSIFTTNSMISEDVSFELQEVYFANKIISLPVRGIPANSLSSNLSYLDKRSNVLIDVFNRYIVQRKFGVECEIILINYVLLLLYDAGTLYADKKAYLDLVEKMYSKVLKHSTIRIIVCNKNLSLRQKMCSFIMILPSKYIRAGYIHLLSKIGEFKRFITSHHG